MNALIFGLGRMGMRHVQALQAMGCKRIVGVDPAVPSPVLGLPRQSVEGTAGDPPRFDMRSVAEPIIYPNAAAALKNESPDLVIVASNGPAHLDNVKAVVGCPSVKAILCEKPMAGSVEDAQVITRLCSEKGLRLAVNHWKRYMPWYQELRKRLKDESFMGKPVSMTVTCGAGGLGCVGVHYIDLARFLFESEIISVTAYLKTNGLPVTRGKQFEDPGLYGVIQFAGGERCFFDFAEDFGLPASVELCGTHGRILMDEESGRHEVRTRPAGKRPSTVRYYGEPLMDSDFSTILVPDLVLLSRVAIENLLDSTIPVISTGEEGSAAIEAYAAARASADQSGAAISFPLEDSLVKRKFAIT